MKVSKALLGAILVGITVQVTATSCTKKGDPQPQTEKQHPRPGTGSDVDNSCPGCGMG